MTEWLAWAWVIGVDLAVIVAAVFATYDRTPLASLRPQHVAAAVIVALAGWEALSNVISALIASAPLGAVDIAFLAAQAIFAVAGGVALVFVLRLSRWAVILGIGLAFVRAVLAVLGLVDTAQYADSFEPGMFASTAAFMLLGAVPWLVAVWLFLDPFLRGELRWRAAPEASAPTTEPGATPEP
ncbi:MAG TPA: hypothetical protein VHR55_01475 [Candidatus Limnocylindria bacterium]|nr:hypothetical protein [Candidatus Limnocylindria bacterium]